MAYLGWMGAWRYSEDDCRVQFFPKHDLLMQLARVRARNWLRCGSIHVGVLLRTCILYGTAISRRSFRAEGLHFSAFPSHFMGSWSPHFLHMHTQSGWKSHLPPSHSWMSRLAVLPGVSQIPPAFQLPSKSRWNLCALRNKGSTQEPHMWVAPLTFTAKLATVGFLQNRN